MPHKCNELFLFNAKSATFQLNHGENKLYPVFYNSAIFQLYHAYGKNKLIINEMMMMSALYYTNTLVGFL